MNLAVVERGKLVGYLFALEHPEGFAKARFFLHFGFTPGSWQIFADALLAHAVNHPVSGMSKSNYGVKYQVDGPMFCPDGRSPPIRTVWIIDAGSVAPRLVTAFPL